MDETVGTTLRDKMHFLAPKTQSPRWLWPLGMCTSLTTKLYKYIQHNPMSVGKESLVHVRCSQKPSRMRLVWRLAEGKCEILHVIIKKQGTSERVTCVLLLQRAYYRTTSTIPSCKVGLSTRKSTKKHELHQISALSCFVAMRSKPHVCSGGVFFHPRNQWVLSLNTQGTKSPWTFAASKLGVYPFLNRNQARSIQLVYVHLKHSSRHSQKIRLVWVR